MGTAYGGCVADQSDAKVPDLSRPQVESLFEQKLAEAFAALGIFNLLVVGKTGVGKSTLVNAMFGSDVAQTGIGEPVTRGLTHYALPDSVLGLYDAEGFETGMAGDAILMGLQALVDQHRIYSSSTTIQLYPAYKIISLSDAPMN